MKEVVIYLMFDLVLSNTSLGNITMMMVEYNMKLVY